MRLMRRCQILATLPMFCIAAAAPAQNGSSLTSARGAANSVDAKACVLHVWPSSEAKSSYMGWFHGGAVNGDRRGIKGYPDLHGDVLSTAVQQQLLKEVDWPTLAELPASSVVVHDAPPAAADDLARTTPLIANAPECYGELIIHSVFVERAAFSATTVRVMVIAKRWQAKLSSPKTYSMMTDHRANFGTGDKPAVELSLKTAFISSVQQVLSAKYFHQH